MVQHMLHCWFFFFGVNYANGWNWAVCTLQALLGPSLTETVFAGWDSFQLWKFVHFFVCLQRWADTCLESIALSLSLSCLQNRPDNYTAIKMPSDDWTEPEASQSSVMAETTAPSISSSAACSTVTAVQVCYSQLHRVTKSWREISSEISGERIFPGFFLVCDGWWLDNALSGVSVALLLLVAHCRHHYR